MARPRRWPLRRLGIILHLMNIELTAVAVPGQDLLVFGKATPGIDAKDGIVDYRS